MKIWGFCDVLGGFVLLRLRKGVRRLVQLFGRWVYVSNWFYVKVIIVAVKYFV